MWRARRGVELGRLGCVGWDLGLIVAHVRGCWCVWCTGGGRSAALRVIARAGCRSLNNRLVQQGRRSVIRDVWAGAATRTGKGPTRRGWEVAKVGPRDPFLGLRVCFYVRSNVGEAHCFPDCTQLVVVQVGISTLSRLNEKVGSVGRVLAFSGVVVGCAVFEQGATASTL